ncbi:hypothetical protein C2G38_2115085 [Gigaspora rosea]|uniref:Uncharacterized protein n=1 Tax=Gigaspora rosea TaxID=44941 RepID=A0A397UCL2_9GLOM|nr:hypothetical protein C2G38_2115085 [Gigaspora rosea]
MKSNFIFLFLTVLATIALSYPSTGSFGHLLKRQECNPVTSCCSIGLVACANTAGCDLSCCTCKDNVTHTCNNALCKN